MRSITRVLTLAFGLGLASLAPQAAQAAFAPSATGIAIEKAAAPQTEVVRGRGGGGRHFGGRGGGGRHFGGRGFRGHGWGGRRHWGGHRRHFWGGPVYYGYPACIRRGWVWNGYRYVWRRYRVC